MKGFECPYCRTIRPSRTVLQRHVDRVHSHVDSVRVRLWAVRSALEVDVPDTMQVDIEPATAQDTTSERLAAARVEILSLKETAGNALTRLEALDAQATDPSVVRSKTLLDVMSMMIDSDNKAGYLTVLTMLRNES